MISLLLRLVKRLFSAHVWLPRELGLFVDNVGLLCFGVLFQFGKLLVQQKLFGVHKWWAEVKPQVVGCQLTGYCLTPLEHERGCCGTKHGALPGCVFAEQDLLPTLASFVSP